MPSGTRGSTPPANRVIERVHRFEALRDLGQAMAEGQVELAVNLRSDMFNSMLRLPSSPVTSPSLNRTPLRSGVVDADISPDRPCRVPNNPQVFPQPRPFSIAFPCTLVVARLNMFQELFPLLAIRDSSHADPGRPGVSTMRGLARPGYTARSRRGL